MKTKHLLISLFFIFLLFKKQANAEETKAPKLGSRAETITLKKELAKKKVKKINLQQQQKKSVTKNRKNNNTPKEIIKTVDTNSLVRNITKGEKIENTQQQAKSETETVTDSVKVENAKETTKTEDTTENHKNLKKQQAKSETKSIEIETQIKNKTTSKEEKIRIVYENLNKEEDNKQADKSNTKWIIGVGVNAINDDGKSSSGSLNLKNYFNPLSWIYSFSTLNVNLKLNRRFYFNSIITSNYLKFQSSKELISKRIAAMDANIVLYTKSTENDKLMPYFSLGLGYTLGYSDYRTRYNYRTLNFGVGTNYWFTKRFGANLYAVFKLDKKNIAKRTNTNYKQNFFNLIYRY